MSNCGFSLLNFLTDSHSGFYQNQNHLKVLDHFKELTSIKTHTIDPVRSQIAAELHQLFGLAFPEIQSDMLSVDTLYAGLERPPRPELGDFSLPCFRFSKSLKLAPHAIAQKIVDGFAQKTANGELSANARRIVGLGVESGFLNIRIDSSLWLRESAASFVDEGAYWTRFQNKELVDREKTMIEFLGANTHKDLHIGHLRNMVLGDSLVRLYRFLGYEVVGVNYWGDEGTHIAKCLWFLEQNNLKEPDSLQGEWLGKQYVLASKKLEGLDAEGRKQADSTISSILADLEAKKEPRYTRWQNTRRWSMDGIRSFCQKMEIAFDHEFCESEFSEESQEIVDEYYGKGVFVLSEGAIGCDLNDEKLGFLLLRKRDGNTLYATKDLGLARKKFEQFGIGRSIYVVGSEQQMHFRQVFKTLEKMGFKAASNCFHLSYGHVRLKEGKMSSREGNVITAADLRGEIEGEIAKVLTKYEGVWPDRERGEAAHRLANCAIRFGMLSADPVKDIIYEAEKWVSFEGHSGCYLAYSYARAVSILTKADVKDVNSFLASTLLSPTVKIELESEVELVREIYFFQDAVIQSVIQNKPSLMSNYLYELSRCFNKFYAHAPILKCEQEDLRKMRLTLVAMAMQTLKKGMNLIGMQPPERM